MSTQSDTPPIPHYAVIFSNQRGEGDAELYEETAVDMADLAARQPGYISHESARDVDGFGITISYWTDEEAISAWKMNVDHLAAQRMGTERFYQSFTLRIALVDSFKTWNR
ncbi:MAG: antibiotic biosynthesis monooxygenase [Rhodospirillales bacterium]|nr:antibiotic biosynthesis monooxygenase [Rhodospirillales bacterium]